MINSITFNQDNSCISLSTDEFHKIYNCEPFGEIYSEDQPTLFVKILFSTSLTIIIPQVKDNRLLKIYNLKQKLKICELIFPSEIIDVKINKKRLVVVLKIGQIYIYDLSCVRLIKIIEINKSSTFIGDLSNDDKSLLVIPLNSINEQSEIFKLVDFESLIKFDKPIPINQLKSHESHGWILIYDTINLVPKLILKCHSSNLQKIIISNFLIATASVKGTIIRIFHLSLLENDELNLFKIQNMRRGHNLAIINSLSFNQDNTILGCGSENNTVHFFNLNEDGQDEEHPEHDDTDNENPAGSDTTAATTPVDGNTSYSSETGLDGGDSPGIIAGDPDSEQHHDDNNPLTDNESSKLSEDLNENLANLLISKPAEAEDTSYTKYTKKIINSSYTKKFFKKLPYKNYLNNLILEPPKRSFNLIKLKEANSKINRVEIGFIDDLILIVSYASGTFYQFKFNQDKRKQCKLINEFNLT